MKFNENLDKVMERLHKNGAFLTVKSGDRINTMTISWGNIGYEWNRPVFIVMVRQSRHTYEMIQNTESFTVSIPLTDEFKSSLAFCGSKSGRDHDKFKECGLKTKPAKAVETPIISGGGYTYECSIVCKQPLRLDILPDEVKDKFYGNGDYHTLYFGEIVECYIEQ